MGYKDNSMRHSRLGSLSVFVVVAMLVSVTPLTLAGAARLWAVALCLAFGLVYVLSGRTPATPGRVAAYFAAQALMTLALIALSGARDTFNFLFYVLGMQAMLVLSTRAASGLIAAAYLGSSLLVVLSRGAAGAVSLVFNAAVFFFTGVFGYLLRQAAPKDQKTSA